MGWVGYFVGKNDHLEELNIAYFTPTLGVNYRDVMEPFLRGVNLNKSIQNLDFEGVDLLEGGIFTMLTPFFQNNHNLTSINIRACVFGDEGYRLFALAIGSSTSKSLRKVQVENNFIVEEGMVDIMTALSVHPHLEYLDFDRNHLRKNGCVALATLLRCSATELQHLDISRNNIGDEGIEALVHALTNCSNLKELHLSNNPSITTKGWQSFAAILESPNSNLEDLYISHNNVDDQAKAAFVKALTNNCRLKEFHLPPLSEDCLWAFSNLLCDTSNVNATFLSNHTLYYLGNEVNANDIIRPLLDLNEGDDKKEVAMIKILQHHRDFEMQPFFEWEFKVLPIILGWLERASVCDMPEGFEPNIEERKLSTIYQFVRGMPVLYVETRLRKELEDIKSEESQMEEKFEEEQRRFVQEFEQRKQEFKQRKQYLQERKESIMKNLVAGGYLKTGMETVHDANCSTSCGG